MVSTRENDWHPPANDVPWMQKARPGLRSVLAGRVSSLAASPSPQDISPDPITDKTGMPVDPRKRGLMREAHETDDSDLALAGNDLVWIVAAVLMLSIYWGAAAVAVGSAMNRGGDVVQQNVATHRNDKPGGDAVPQTSTQKRAANVTNYKDSGTR